MVVCVVVVSVVTGITGITGKSNTERLTQIIMNPENHCETFKIGDVLE